MITIITNVEKLKMAKQKIKPTKKEKIHMHKVVSLGCIVCNNNGFPDSPAELHHISNGAMGMKASHYEVIPLCHAHHRTGGFGIAIHAGIRVWQEYFGDEEELLAQVNEEIGYKK
jgi:hypothetical protein